MEQKEAEGLARFIFELGHLRFEERRGWQRLRVKPENVAEHSLRAAQIAFFLAESEGGVDPYYVLSLLVFHDISEIRTGDADRVAKHYVASDEHRAVRDQTEPMGSAGKKIVHMWKEAKEAETPEGRIARDADLLDMAFTAKELMHHGRLEAKTWFETAGRNIHTTSAKSLFEALKTVQPDDWWKKMTS